MKHPNLNLTQHAFTTGQISKSVRGRTDVEMLQSAVKKAINVLPLGQGPMVGRSGFEYIADTKFQNKKARLIPFTFAIDQSLVIEMGEYYFRFYLNGGQIQSSIDDGVFEGQSFKPGDLFCQGPYYTNALQYRRCITANVYSNQEYDHTAYEDVGIDDLFSPVNPVGRFYPNTYYLAGAPIAVEQVNVTGRMIYYYKAKRTFTTASTFNVDDWDRVTNVGDYRFTAGTYEIKHPYPENEVDEVTYAGEADAIYLCHPKHNPMRLLRYGNTDWRLENFIFEDGPFNSLNSNFAYKCHYAVVYKPNGNENSGFLVGNYVEIRPATNSVIFPGDPLQYAGRLFIIRVPKTSSRDGGYGLVRIISVGSQGYAYAKILNAPANDIVTELLKTGTNGKTTWAIGAFNGQVTGTSIYVRATDNSNQPAAGRYDFRPDVKNTLAVYGIIYPSVWVHKDAVINDGKIVSGFWMAYGYAGGLHWLGFNGPQTLTTANVFYYGIGEQWAAMPYPATYTARAAASSVALVVEYNVPEGEVPIRYGETPDWPSIVCLHQTRLIYASTPTKPQTIYFSQSAGYNSFCPVNEYNEVLDDSAFSYNLSGGDINQIFWMVSGTTLVCGTAGDEFIAVTSNDSSPITPTDISFKRQSSRGSVQYQRALLQDGVVLFVQRLGNVIRTLVYDAATLQYKTQDLTKLADDILEKHGGFKEWAYSPEPSGVIWIVCNDGFIVTLTYEPDDKVIAFAEIVPGGNLKVLNIAIVPSADNQFYDKYVISERHYNNGTKRRMIERMLPFSLEKENFGFLDSSIKDGIFYGRSLLVPHIPVGEEIDVIINGKHIGKQTVIEYRDYGFTIPCVVSDTDDIDTWCAGYAYKQFVQMLPVATQLQNGTTVGKAKRVLKVIAAVNDTCELLIGRDENNLMVALDEENNKLQVDVPKTGEYGLVFEDDVKLVSGDLYLVNTKPYPFNLLTVTREVEFRD